MNLQQKLFDESSCYTNTTALRKHKYNDILNLPQKTIPLLRYLQREIRYKGKSFRISVINIQQLTMQILRLFGLSI